MSRPMPRRRSENKAVGEPPLVFIRESCYGLRLCRSGVASLPSATCVRRPPEPVSVRTVRLTTACLASLRPGFRCIASFVASIFTIAVLLIWQALQHRSGSQLLTRPHSPL